MNSLLFNRLLEYINAAKVYDNNYMIAVYIAKHFDEVASMNIGELADGCFVSPSTISRFCRFMGYASYADFRKNLIHSVESVKDIAAEEQRLIDMNQDLAISYEAYLADVAESVAGVRNMLNFEQIDALLLRINQTPRVMLFGYKNSALIAQHLQSGLMYAYKYLEYYSDNFDQLARINELREGDFAIIVTVEGRYLNTMSSNIVKARKRGVYTLCITHSDSSKINELFNETLVVGSNPSTIGGRYALNCMVDILVSRYLATYRKK